MVPPTFLLYTYNRSGSGVKNLAFISMESELISEYLHYTMGKQYVLNLPHTLSTLQ